MKQLMYEISKFRQQRQSAERRCEQTGKMLAACLIFRGRVKGQRGLQSLKTIGANRAYQKYAYLTCFYQGQNRYKYIPRGEVAGVERLTTAYRNFCQQLQQVRELNRQIVARLVKIGERQTEELKKYV